ncbi:glycyl radical protein [Blautia wexlerae]|jgi:pyruvate formate-lyase/glycerol dehydratase family glycyl radical enzyme|uniref:glycyl radical protein n=2 Tax=Blautia wexlerae TaxID=418240 RepID=UPI00156D6DA6|nr:glycyl radical protein [Blautia wexlerae]NSE04470.1 glycyl radical protein [Blautia wexlerae]NSF78124.1 glycyl radical protein [Blautia wexlerae]
MEKFQTSDIPKSPRIQKLVDALYEHMPVIESARAKLITESYKETEGEPIITRRAKAFAHILHNIPIIIRDNELIVGSSTIAPRGCQTFPEFSYEWLEAELDTVATRTADPFEIAEETKAELKEADKYWKGKTTSELATSYMAPEAIKAIEHNIFTPGNYFYNGVGHVTVKYWEVLETGFEGIMEKAQKELDGCSVGDGNYARKSHFLEAVILSCKAVIDYAGRYAKLAQEMAAQTSDPVRKQELLVIAENCSRVPAKGAQNFYEACQSFWFVQQLLQMESSGHSISPGRFDQYMYPYYKKDMEAGTITREFAQELMDCIWVKLNDLNKCRDAASAEGFAGYSLFQNLIAGGQNKEGEDVTNDLSIMCIQASMHVHLPAPSLSVRVWNGSPHEFLIKAAELTRTGIGLPAYYNDEVIIPALQNRGLSLEDAREYNIIGCVEPQKAGKTEGWHDAAFFNMCRPLELVFSNGMDKGEMVGIPTGDVTQMKTFDEFFDAYKKQMEYCISLLVNADNAIDVAHAERCPLPFLSCMIDDCLKEGKSVQEGGAVYNFTGPQGFGIANMADGLFAIRKLVYEDKKVSMKELKEALAWNYDKGLDAQSAGDMTEMIMKAMQKAGRNVDASTAEGLLKTFMGMKPGEQKTQRFKEIHDMIDEVPKFGNDIPEVDYFAREVAYTYSKPLQKYNNPRGGKFQAGLYPVSANVPLGGQTGATPDGRYAHTPVADGVSPSAGKDVKGPTAAATSVSRLDHFIVSNGTLFNQKFHPSALSGREGLEKFVALIRGYFDQKGMHMQFNVVDRQTLLDAQEHPEKYKHLVVRVAGYSALFTTLSRSLQDDIIRRTEQGF